MHAGGHQPAAPTPDWAGRTAPSAHNLPRLLASWGTRLRTPRQPITPRLADAMGWMDAVALAQVLAARPAPTDAPDAETPVLAARRWAEAALERLVAELHAAFAEPTLVQGGPPLPSGAFGRGRAIPVRSAGELNPQDAVAPYRLHHATQQRALASRVATFRTRLRAQLSEAGPALAQLAAFDAVFDRALAEAEQQRLSGLSALLVQRGLDLQAQQPSEPGEPAGADAWPPVGWRATFWADVQRLLRAELDLRLQPVLGLLEALNEAAAAEAPPSDSD
ncbi:MAG: DUF3348 family protein [Inhella sp.]|uniref:DUF3348 family protein n=1 Tax=Inhella sp. TaxID=1921806 RepID=UPI00391EF698